MSRLCTFPAIALLAAAAVTLTATPAGAQDRDPGGNDQAADEGSAPAAAQMRVAFGGVRRSDGARLAPPGRRVRVHAMLAPYAEGEQITVRIYRGRSRVGTRRLPAVKMGDRDAGHIRIRFTPRAQGIYTVLANHASSEAVGYAATARRFGMRFPHVRSGSRGRGVRDLQGLLARRGYSVSRSGIFDGGTRRAVLAFRKVNGMARNNSASTAVWRRLVRGGAYAPRYRRTGERRRVEVDRRRQVMALIRRDRVYRVYHVSTGKPSTPTILGRYRMYRKEPGVNNVGMVHSVYFRGGYALHGYPSVPTHPASAGCVRAPIPNARHIFDWLRIGDRIDIYDFGRGASAASTGETWGDPRMRVSVEQMKRRNAADRRRGR